MHVLVMILPHSIPRHLEHLLCYLVVWERGHHLSIEDVETGMALISVPLRRVRLMVYLL